MTTLKYLSTTFMTFAIIGLSGCNMTNSSMATNDTVKQPNAQSSTQCAPFDANDEIKMCTAHFDPVCVKEKDASGKISYRTAGNSCSACGTPQAISYTPGECQ